MTTTFDSPLARHWPLALAHSVGSASSGSSGVSVSSVSFQAASDCSACRACRVSAACLAFSVSLALLTTPSAGITDAPTPLDSWPEETVAAVVEGVGVDFALSQEKLIIA